jgi:polysaccharide deacetylase family sporulation protein PdaB
MIFTKQKIIMFAVCACALALAAIIAVNTTFTAITTASSNRVIPIYCVDRGEEKICSISFDAAWGDEQTNTLLDTLDKYKVKSTFFLVGDWVDKYPDAVKEIAKRGHDIGSHSDTHPHMTQLSESKMTEELKLSQEKITAITGKPTTLFRPPYGDYNNAVVNAVKAQNMYCVQWDVDTLDWMDPSPSQMVQTVQKKLKPGSIILMHNGAKNAPEALPMILEYIQKQGYKLVPISQLIPSGEYYTDHEGKMHLGKAPE